MSLFVHAAEDSADARGLWITDGTTTADGTSDLLFRNAGGTYATRDLSGTSIVGGGVIGNPVAAGFPWAYSI